MAAVRGDWKQGPQRQTNRSCSAAKAAGARQVLVSAPVRPAPGGRAGGVLHHGGRGAHDGRGHGRVPAPGIAAACARPFVRLPVAV